MSHKKTLVIIFQIGTMVHLAGIIHPTAFQITELLGSISRAFSPTKPFQFFGYKNLELGVWNATLATNEQKTVWAMVDGKITNSRELRTELKKLGYSFSTEGDSELIVRGYEAWKESFIPRLNGDFAAAVFDEENELLFILRDRVGKKNLYWTTKGEYWLFSTEIKGLLATEMVPQTPSTIGLGSYLYFGYIPQDITPIKGVNKLLPGHYLKIDLSRQLTIEQYWSLGNNYENQVSTTKEEALHKFGEIFDQSMRSVIPESGPFGIINTENLGSSALNWQANQIADKNRIHSYFPSDLKPEELLSDLVQMVWHLDEPIGDPYILQAWHLAKSAAGKTPILLADLGWTEMFAGDPRYFQARYPLSPPLAHRLATLPQKFLKEALIPCCKFLHLKQQWRILRNIDIDRDQILYLMQQALFKGRQRQQVSPFLNYYFDPETFAQRFHRLGMIPGSINPFLYFDTKTELPDFLLRQYERLFAPFGVKLSTPFLDNRMVEMMAQMGEKIKIEENMPGGFLQNYLRQVGAAPPEPKDSLIQQWSTRPQFRELRRSSSCRRTSSRGATCRKTPQRPRI